MISKKVILKCKMLIFHKLNGVTKQDLDMLFTAVYGKLPRYCFSRMRRVTAIMRGNGSEEIRKGQYEYSEKGFPYSRVIRFVDDSDLLTMLYTMGGKTNLMSPKENKGLADFIDKSRYNKDLRDVLFVMFMLGVVDRYSVVEYLMDITEFSDRLVFEDERKETYDGSRIPVDRSVETMLYVMTFCCAISNYEDADFNGDNPWDMIDFLYDMYNPDSQHLYGSVYHLNELFEVFGFKWDYYPVDGIHFDMKYYDFICWLLGKENVSNWVRREVLLNSFDKVSIVDLNRNKQTLQGANSIGTIEILESIED